MPRTSLFSIKVHRIPDPGSHGALGAHAGRGRRGPGLPTWGACERRGPFGQNPLLLPKTHSGELGEIGGEFPRGCLSRGTEGEERVGGWPPAHTRGVELGPGVWGEQPGSDPCRWLRAPALAAVSVTAQTRCHHPVPCIRSVLQRRKPNFFLQPRCARTHTERAWVINLIAFLQNAP